MSTDFVAAVSRMVRRMVSMGYDAEKVKGQVRRFIQELPHLFFSNRGRRWGQQIMEVIDDARRQRQSELSMETRRRARNFIRELEARERSSFDASRVE